MEVLVFKTSVSKTAQISQVESLLNVIPAIEKWNFDLEDCDNILRVVADGLSPRTVEAALHQAGITCLELT